MITVNNFELDARIDLAELQYDLVLEALGVGLLLQKAERARLMHETIGQGLAMLRCSMLVSPEKTSPFDAPSPDALLSREVWRDLQNRLRKSYTDPLTAIRLHRMVWGAEMLYYAYAELPIAVKQQAVWESGNGLVIRERLRNYAIDIVKYPEVSAEQSKLVNTAFRLAAAA